MKKFILGAVAAAAVAAPVALAASPASAATSKAPSMSAPSVNKGQTIKVYINNHGSKLVSKANTLWQNGHRVSDWSPKPGTYKVKSVIKWRPKTTTQRKAWVSDRDCDSYSDPGYDENGDGDYNDPWDYPPYDACAIGEYGHWHYSTITSYGAKRTVTRYDHARVASDESPGCVSGSEFRAIRDGMTQAKVHSIFGTSGWVTNTGSGGTTREYTTCEGDPDWSYVEVDFDPRVWFKWRYISY